jgi:alpha-glucosidase (family GH31 glycosyl hydrolase)
MISDALMLAPVLEQGKTVVWPYLPRDKWYNFKDGKKL